MEKYQADQSFQKQYEKYVKQVTPTHNLALQMLHAFVTGGIICTVGQIILNVAKLNGLDDAAAGSVCAILRMARVNGIVSTTFTGSISQTDFLRAGKL